MPKRVLTETEITAVLQHRRTGTPIIDIADILRLPHRLVVEHHLRNA